MKHEVLNPKASVFSLAAKFRLFSHGYLKKKKGIACISKGDLKYGQLNVSETPLEM